MAKTFKIDCNGCAVDVCFRSCIDCANSLSIIIITIIIHHSPFTTTIIHHHHSSPFTYQYSRPFNSLLGQINHHHTTCQILFHNQSTNTISVVMRRKVVGERKSEIEVGGGWMVVGAHRRQDMWIEKNMRDFFMDVLLCLLCLVVDFNASQKIYLFLGVLLASIPFVLELSGNDHDHTIMRSDVSGTAVACLHPSSVVISTTFSNQ